MPPLSLERCSRFSTEPHPFITEGELGSATLGPVRRSFPLLLPIVVCLVFWQVWLTWRLMDQDRNLAAQRSRERQIADLALAQLTSMLAGWDLSLRETDAVPPPAALKARFPSNGTLILLAPQSVAATYPRQPLLFIPNVPACRSDDRQRVRAC